ncbi:hypothetical protein AVEN_213809-1 [Araneus ventricosus]|uniref:Uncharacterized protein n=1 Tax=Araneus ventricosus TaxID=182803 RepID=A0A4Y2GLY7_ARAVE|nr:hypothetical protein AVEN_213809-1 [Araneus ventricosus]
MSLGEHVFGSISGAVTFETASCENQCEGYGGRNTLTIVERIGSSILPISHSVYVSEPCLYKGTFSMYTPEIRRTVSALFERGSIIISLESVLSSASSILG